MRITVITVGAATASQAAGAISMGPMGAMNLGSLPRVQVFEVTGTFETLMYEYDNNYAYVPLTEGGLPTVLQLSGLNTLRLTMLGTQGQDNRKVYLNYLLFVPTSETPALPQLGITNEGDLVKLYWPMIPWRLERSPSLTNPVWTEVTTGITVNGDQYEVVQPATDSGYYRLLYP